jgi:hypothetical protein
MEPGVRVRLARALKSPAVDDTVWAYLLEGGYVRDAEDPNDVEGFEYLVAQARLVRRHFRAKRGEPRTARSRSIPIEESSTAYHVVRAKARSAYLARVASEDGSVGEFRSRVLGDRRLEKEEAEHFLDSDVLRFFGEYELGQFGIPTVGHRSRASYRGPDGREVSVYSIDRSVFIVRCGDRDFEIPYPLPLEMRISRSDCPVLAILPKVRAKPWTAGGFRDRSGRVLSGSVLGDLRQVSVDLAQRLHWEEADATWFVLTGKTPYVSAIEVRAKGNLGTLFNRQQIVLTADTWVPETEVIQAYRNARRKLQSRRQRQPASRNLAVFEFLISTTGGGQPEQSWAKLMDRWNEHCPRPEWRYTDRWRFCRDFNRVRDTVIYPEVAWP